MKWFYIPKANVPKTPAAVRSSIWARGSRVQAALTRLEGVDGFWVEVAVGVGACVVLFKRLE